MSAIVIENRGKNLLQDIIPNVWYLHKIAPFIYMHANKTAGTLDIHLSSDTEYWVFSYIAVPVYPNAVITFGAKKFESNGTTSGFYLAEYDKNGVFIQYQYQTSKPSSWKNLSVTFTVSDRTYYLKPFLRVFSATWSRAEYPYITLGPAEFHNPLPNSISFTL